MHRIAVVPHDPHWATAFAEASGPIAAAMGGNLVQLHHIGSTAIPGIYAKPVIDMLVIVSDISAVDQCSSQIQSLGYEVMANSAFRHAATSAAITLMA